ncbi:MAG: hypothetical protein PHX18_04075 [Candidatus Gastranaerophilales bacterium]|nr:hypothetical protein [Candidatus Gastranaerophilales bacterium]
MNYEEYKSLYEAILEKTEIVEKLCKEKKFDDVKEPFEQRYDMVAKLADSQFNLEELDEEKFEYILKLTKIMKEKNEFILKAMQLQKMEIKKEILGVKQEQDVIDAYQIKSTEKTGNSIFDI